MSTDTSLSSIFNETKSELASALAGLSLPKDSQEVQSRISAYLNQVCDENNEFRQNLTQSEDYILQAALSMLSAQRDMVSALSSSPKVESTTSTAEQTTLENAPKSIQNSLAKASVPAGNALMGAGGGALIGKIVLGGWGAVFGAIAGTALVLYLAQQPHAKSVEPARQLKASPDTAVEVKIVETPVNTEALLNVVEQLCESLDNLILTFRAQIQRVINKYESQEKPTIEREYLDLLEKIQSLLGAYAISTESEIRSKRIDQRIELLEESLENYDLKAVVYDGQNDTLFIMQPSPNVAAPTMAFPAIIKNGKTIIKGKVFTKQ